jgi:predicted TIM-barrel enzyme
MKMGKQFTRLQVLERLKGETVKGKVIFEAAVGAGISAKWSEAGGADLIATYNIAKYRMMGYSHIGYLPIGDANQIVLDLGTREIFPVLKNLPLIAGVFGADPTRDMGAFLDEVMRRGFSGVLNCPTLALMDGKMRQGLERIGVGYQREVDMIALAREKGLFTQAFVTNEEETSKMLKAGADMIICHLGGTTPAKEEERESRMVQVAEHVKEIFRICREFNPEVIRGCHGGPIAFPDDVRQLKKNVPDVQAFLGGSSAERLPIEVPIKNAVHQFKEIEA